MAITFVNAGVVAKAITENLTPAAPASIQNNDILLLVVCSSDNVSHSVDNSYTQKFQGDGGTTTRLSVWYKRTNGTEGTTTVTHTLGDTIEAFIVAYRGVWETGDPFDAFGVADTNTDSTAEAPAVTTSRNFSMAVGFGGSADANTWSVSGGSGLTGLTIRVQDTETLGVTDNSIWHWSAEKTLPGSIGTVTMTQDTNGPDRWIAIAGALLPKRAIIPVKTHSYRNKRI